MCGIVGYIGNRQAYPILIKGLKRLEYRGYDSSGIALLNGKTNIYKKRGKVSDLEAFLSDSDVSGNTGIGHTRWATHGEPNDINAHPHESQNGLFVVIHNGIIENFNSLKTKLVQQGYEFKSDTDTEVLANLIEYIYQSGDLSPEEAVRLALNNVVGAYGLVIACKDKQNQLIAARKGSPLVIGIGENEYFIASDATPIVEYTNSVIYLNNDNIAVISRNEISLKTINNDELKPIVEKLELDLQEIEKGGFPHFMLKEIFEQSSSIKDTFRGRVAADLSYIRLGGLMKEMDRILSAKRFIMIGCGTSWHAGLVGEYLFEKFARVPVEVEYASEFRYRNPVLYPDDVVIAISQSGETADTLAAIQIAKENNALVLGVCNVVGSSIPRETHAGVYTHAGPEIGVASTKAFTAQVTILAMMAFLLGEKRGTLTPEKYKRIIKALVDIPEKVIEILNNDKGIYEIAELYKDSSNFLYLGRGSLFPVALEGALKLKEISYIHAEGYPAAEMKHGPIALIDEKMPVVVIATKDKSYEKIVNNIQEIKARNGVVIAIVTEGDTTIKEIADHVICIPDTDVSLIPILSVIPLQLLSYRIAVVRDCNVDQPRNLAKSVTVE
ncbi:MAG: glutamine--fructose-6-phosphate transaminase (isomerizing) [Bacteroidia bacterium]|nr:MAG: glutamine--fructose-6-phosphate transaminase (isomerizing) [Bacteroidia bacterium]